MEGFHPDWQGYLKPLIALVAPESIQEHLYDSISSFRPKTSLFCDKYLELKCLNHKELLNPSISSFVTPSRNLIKSSLTISSSPSAYLGNRAGHGLGGIDILSVNWMHKVRYDTPALYILCFDWQEYPLSRDDGTHLSVEEQEKISSLENDAVNVIKSVSAILKKRQSPPSVLIFVILPTGTADPQSCVACFRKNHFPELQAIFVTCGLKHQKQLNIRIERLAEMAYETSQAYYSENERRWRKSAIKAQTAGITASSENFSFPVKSSSSGFRYSLTGSAQSGLSPKFKRSSYHSNSAGLNLLQRTTKNNNSSFTSSSSGNASSYNITQLQSRVLLIRYCIKSAVMNEFCGNFALATKQYVAAWDNILSETNIPPYQFVVFCNIISIRLYHIHVINGDIREAMNHLKIHTRILREFGSNHPRFSFLSSLWLSLTLQKLASILFFYIVNKQSHCHLLGDDCQGLPGSKFPYPDGIETSVIPLSVNTHRGGKENANGGDDGSDNVNNWSNDLGDTLSLIAKSIQNIVIRVRTTSCARGGSDGGRSVQCGNGELKKSHTQDQGDDVVDILLNISKLYKASAEHSHKSRKLLLEISERYSDEFFGEEADLGGEVLHAVSLGCFQELSSPEAFLESEQKINLPKNFFDDLSTFSSLYIGHENIDLKKMEDKNLFCEVLASCEVVRRYIRSLLRDNSLFNRCISLFYMSAVVYRHFYPSKLRPSENVDDDGEGVDKDPSNNFAEVIKVIKNDMSENYGSRSLMNRFFYMISFSFAEYLFDENYINCSLCIYESIFKAIVPRHVFPETEGLKEVNEQDLRNLSKRKNPSVWETLSKQITSTCFHITSNFIKSKAWLFIRKICLRIITCLSIQNMSLEDNKRELTKMCSLVSWNCESGDDDFLSKLNKKILNLKEVSGVGSANGKKKDDQYIYSVVTSFLTVINSKKSWIDRDYHGPDKNFTHYYILLFCYIIIACDIENSSNNNFTCKRDIFEFHDWITKLYIKIINLKSNLQSFCCVSERDKNLMTRSPKNVILTHFLHNTYSTVRYDADMPSRIKVEIHHLPNFVCKLVDEKMELELISNIGILNVRISNLELYEFKEENNFNIRIRMDCTVNQIDFIPSNNERSDLVKCYYKEYAPEIMIFGIFAYFHVGPCENDYIKFAINSIKCFDFKKIVERNSKHVYNYSYVQFCLRSPPLSYFSNIGSWLRSSKTLIYSTPRLSVVPGGFLDINSNTVVNPIPLFKIPFDQVYLVSKVRFPYNSLPIFCKLNTKNTELGGACERMANIQKDIDNLKRMCKLWLLSPFNALNVVLSESKDKIDCVEKVAYNSVVNELRPLELVLRLPSDIKESFKIDISLNINRVVPQSSTDYGEISNPQGCEEDVISRFGYIKIPKSLCDEQWKVVLSESSVSMSDSNNSRNSAICNNQNTLLYPSTTPYNSNARFTIDYELVAQLEGDSTADGGGQNEDPVVHENELYLMVVNEMNINKMVHFHQTETAINTAPGNNKVVDFVSKDVEHENQRNSSPVPFFKVTRGGGTKFGDNSTVSSTGEDPRYLLLFLPLFLSVSRSGEYEVTANLRILDDSRVSGEDTNNETPHEPKTIIIHELIISKKWVVGECVAINSEIPEMNSLNGTVNYLDSNHNQLQGKIVPLNSENDNGQYLSVLFEVANKQYKDLVYIDEFTSPKKFSILDNNFPLTLNGYETSSIMINVDKDDFHKHYLSEDGKSIKAHVLENSEYTPEIVISLLYTLSCDAKFSMESESFLNFVLFPFQLVIPRGRTTDPSKMSFKSLPIRYNLLNNLLRTLILPYTRFFPITLETKVDQVVYTKTPFNFEATITNHTNLPQGIKYYLMYPPDPLPPDERYQDNSNLLPEWLPLLVQGVMSNYIILGPNSKRILKWVCVPTQSGTIPLPCLHILSDRSNRQFISASDTNSSRDRSNGGALSLFNNDQMPSMLFTSEKRIVVIPRS